MLTPKVLGGFLIILGVFGYIFSEILESKLIFFYSCMSLLLGIAACIRILANPETMKNKYILICGIDSEFGNKLATYLCSVGAFVFTIYDDNQVDVCQRLLKQFPDNFIPIKRSPNSEDYKSILNDIEEILQNKTLKAVIFASDDFVSGDLEILTQSRISHMWKKNVSEVVTSVKAFLPLLRESRGRVIFFGHAFGRLPLPSTAAYSLTKCALEGFADGLRHEMRRFDVKVIIVEPCGHHRLTADQTLADSMWSEATQDARETYGEDYVRRIAQTRASDETGAQRVVQTFLEALAADNPKDRYFVCAERRHLCVSKIETIVSQFLPATLMDLWIDRRHTASLPKCLRIPPPMLK